MFLFSLCLFLDSNIYVSLVPLWDLIETPHTIIRLNIWFWIVLINIFLLKTYIKYISAVYLLMVIRGQILANIVCISKGMISIYLCPKNKLGYLVLVLKPDKVKEKFGLKPAVPRLNRGLLFHFWWTKLDKYILMDDDLYKKQLFFVTSKGCLINTRQLRYSYFKPWNINDFISKMPSVITNFWYSSLPFQ